MGYTAEVRSQKLAQVRLYVQSELGLLQALDAESGRSLWLSRLAYGGIAYFPSRYMAIGWPSFREPASKSWMPATGAEVWQRKMEGLHKRAPRWQTILS